jgi:LysR family nitrogen assimilation transcriptional regulator
MDLISLRYFVETARMRSISRAAAGLGVVQPALTRRIQLLEERLGVQLLMRHRRGVEPTEAGLLVLERSELILRMAQQLETEARSKGLEAAGPVAFGFPPSIGILMVGKLLSECGAKYPRIKLLLQEDYSAGVQSSLLSGRLDIGIMSCEAQHPDLMIEPLFKESMWLIGKRKEWRFGKERIHPSNLDKLPLLVGSFMRTLLEKQTGRFGYKLNVAVEANSLSLAREALRAGAGYFVAPLSALDAELKSKQFAGAALDGLEVTRGLFHHRDRPLTRAALTFASMVRSQVNDLCSAKPDAYRRLKSFK